MTFSATLLATENKTRISTQARNHHNPKNLQHDRVHVCGREAAGPDGLECLSLASGRTKLDDIFPLYLEIGLAEN